MARTAPVPATASIQCWTIPSPPQTKMSSAPSAIAQRANFGALRLLVTSYQSGSANPWLASTSRNCGRPPPKLFLAWATTATVDMSGSFPDEGQAFTGPEGNFAGCERPRDGQLASPCRPEHSNTHAEASPP